MTIPRVILGTPLHDLNLEETLLEIERMIEARSGGYLATANVDFLRLAWNDVELQRLLIDAHRVLCDGTPLLWISRWLGSPIRERAAGSDLIPLLARRAAARGFRLFLMGSTQEVLELARDAMLQVAPGLQIVGMDAPPRAAVHEMGHGDTVARIREARPDILLVALGAPKQEKWSAMHLVELDVPVLIGVGGGLDMMAGKFRRAPVWMRRAGLEWFHRLVLEPRRLFGRYLADFVFLARFLPRQLAAQRRVRQPPSPSTGKPLPDPSGPLRLAWQGMLDRTSLSRVPWPQFSGSHDPIVLDLSEVCGVDADGIGLLALLDKDVRRHGGALLLLRPAAPVRRLLEATRLSRLFVTLEDETQLESWLARHSPDVLSFEEAASTLRLALHQELTAAWLADRGSVVPQAWQAHPDCQRLLLDLADVPFMDTTGLAYLLECQATARTRPGGTFAVCNAAPNVAGVIRLAGLENLLDPSRGARTS